MKSFLTRVLSTIIPVLLVLCVMPVSPVRAFVYGPVSFIDENGDPQTCTGYHSFDAAWWNDKIYGWNVVDGNVVIRDERQVVDGDAYIIIPDGSSLTITKGLTVSPGSVLYIYGQSGSTGKLILNEEKVSKHAGLGGENNGPCGTIVINGGVITVYGGSDAAAIGGGNEPSDGNVNSSITINGGTVYAYGGKYGAGIGGGDLSSAGTIVINNKYKTTVNAYGGSDAAGIGSGDNPNDGNVNSHITINGGKVNAYGGKLGAGIGGGDEGDGGTIVINGGKVYAEGGQEAAAIGGGDGDGTKYGNGGTITINGGEVTAVAFEYEYNYNDICLGAGIGGGTEGGAGTITINGGKVQATGQRGGAGIGSGCDVNEKSNKDLIGGTITINGGEVHGDTPDPLDGNLNYGGGAGIGSGRNSPGCDITISGGTIYASGSQKNYHEDGSGDGGAGIGNSQHSSGGSVTITGGSIQAFTACKNAAPIGKGAGGSKPTCTLDYPECKVYWWKYGSTHISLEAERAADAFKKVTDLTSKIYIAPCDHPNIEYQSNETLHSAHCDYCGWEIEENHIWKYVNVSAEEKHQEVCKICGYEGQLHEHAFNQSNDKCICGVQGIRVRFDANGGSGEMPDVTFLKGKSYNLPECRFTAPEGKQFIGWRVPGYNSILYPGYSLWIPQEAFTVTAQWDDIWYSLQEQIDEAENGDTIVLNKNYKAGPDDVEYFIASNKEITIDLNGHSIDRALYTEQKNYETKGSVFRVEGKLTIIDSSSSASGIIEGGYPTPADTGAVALIDSGGAFMVDGGTLTIKNGTIQECMGVAGAVWLANGATFNFEGGTIMNTKGFSATVAVSGDSTFNMSGGRIRDNHNDFLANDQYDLGNAVVYVPDGSFHMSGGSIMDNDGQLYSFSSESVPLSAVRFTENGTFSVSGAPFIMRNGHRSDSGEDETLDARNVYLAEGQTIKIDAELTSYATICVSVEDEPQEGETRILTDGLYRKGTYSKFYSDNDAYIIRANDDGEAILKIDDGVVIPVETVELNETQLDLRLGEEYDLIAFLHPEDTTQRDVFWMTDPYNTEVISVDQYGRVTALAGGEADVIVYCLSGQYATCHVTVTAPVAVESVELNKNELTLVEGEEETLIADVKPDDAENKNVLWESSDSTIATVDENGKVTAIEKGTATIYVITEDGEHTAECFVTVACDHEWTDATCTEAKTCSKCGETEGDPLGHDWSVSEWNWNEDYSQATARFLCAREGSHTEIVRAQISMEETDVAYVYTATAAFEGEIYTDVQALSKNAFSIEGPDTVVCDNTAQFNVTMDSLSDRITWSVSDESLAVIDDTGTLTGMKAGIVTVTATCDGLVSESKDVRVLFKDVADSSKYFYNPVYWAFDSGITTGTSATKFSPNDNCTRGQVVTFLWRAMGCPEPTIEN
ncbi:MAG: Ig-like domain-containing protein, partial [Erysipelotrichaceae bacterium]|nr:Ig-like domain-containing protein [Erysipelotrichaceae bacterium]